MAETSQEQKVWSTKLNPNGRIVIPVAVREELGIRPGDTVSMEIVDRTLRVESYSAKLRRIQQEFQQYIQPGESVSDELIHDRRQEARRELEQERV